MAGEVIAVGEDVKEWKVGDRVCANFIQDKLHDDSPSESMLSGSVHGVLTEYRTFPAQVHSLNPSSIDLLIDNCTRLSFPSQIISHMKKLQHYRQCYSLSQYSLATDGAADVPQSPLTTPFSLASSRSRPGTQSWFKERAGHRCAQWHTTFILHRKLMQFILPRFALQFAVASGATVIATSSSDEKLRIATKLGARHVINYRTTPDWAAEVLKLTNGVGVDRVIEVRLKLFYLFWW